MLLDPGQALHERGLADAVDANEPDPLPSGDAERDVAELEALTVVRLAEAVAVHEACTSAGGGGDGGRSAGGGGRAVCARVVARTQRRSRWQPAGSDVQRQQQRSKDELHGARRSRWDRAKISQQNRERLLILAKVVFFKLNPTQAS